MDLQRRRYFFNRLNPDEPLEPLDERNVDIDVDPDPALQPRGANWVDALARSIELSDKPVCQFFTGLPGSGKSTELRRLAARLRDGGAHLLPVVVDAEERLDVFSPIDVADIVVMSLYCAERAVLEAEGGDPQMALRDGYLTRIWHWLNTTEVELKSVTAGATVPGLKPLELEAEAEIKTQPTFREELRRKVTAQLATFLEHARAEAAALEKRARARGWSGLALLVDSLEKLRGMSTNWNEVLASAERVFAGEAPYLQLGLHTVYTIPPALVLRLKVPVHFMPMLKLAHRDGAPFEPGRQAARALIERRLPPEAQAEVFGASHAQRVEELIDWSGGYPREIVRLLKNCVAQAPLGEPLFRRLMTEAGDDYRRTVVEDSLDVLAAVALEGRLLFADKDRAAVDQVLANNLVLRYRNDEEWFDLHPALRGHAPVQAAIERRRKAARDGEQG